MGQLEVVIHIGPFVTFGREAVEGMLRYARTRLNWHVHIETDSARLTKIKRWRPSGFLGGFGQPKLRKALRRYRAPVVDLLHGSEPSGVWAVINDEQAIGRAAAEHLIGNGFNRLAMIGHPGVSMTRDRRAGFEEVVDEAGLSAEFIDASMLYEPTKRIRARLRAIPTPSAVFAADDEVARAVLNVIRNIGLDVPDDIAVVGVNDSILCPFTSPPLSSVAPDWGRIGFEGGALLDLVMAGRTPPATQIHIPPLGLSVRQSSDKLAIDDPELNRAVRWIREHADQNVNVGDLLREVPISRWSLERKCRDNLGHTPFQEIRKTQVEYVKQLLIRTDWDIARVAVESAFRDFNHLGAQFRKYTGMTPTGFRARHRSH